jgi:hypothetical protein
MLYSGLGSEKVTPESHFKESRIVKRGVSHLEKQWIELTGTQDPVNSVILPGR